MAAHSDANPADPRPPLVLVPACNRRLGASAFQVVGQKYVDAVRLAGALPLVVPTAEAQEIGALLALADGIFLTGSPSNVHPGRFGEEVHDPSLPLDVARDAWLLPLIPQALALGIPLLAVCRGFQEVNVALGGSLHQAVQEQPGHAEGSLCLRPERLRGRERQPLGARPGRAEDEGDRVGRTEAGEDRPGEK